METELNIELFQKVRDKIATTPEAYDQSVYGRTSTLAPCGTVACIAGWACVLSGEMTPEALHTLNDLDVDLVHHTARKDATRKEYPQVAIAYLDQIISTGALD